MKKIALNIFALGMIGIAFTACDDAKNDAIDNMVYISEAASEPATEIILGKTGETSSTTITVRMGQKAAVDTKVQLALDPQTLENYNKRNDTEFAVLPSEYIEFPAEVIVEAGTSTVEVPLTITSFDGEKGVDYAAPIKVVSAEGQTVSKGSGAYIITFGKPLIQKAPQFAFGNGMKMPWEGTIDLTNLTLEWWCRVINTAGNGGFSVNNQALFSLNANHELYVRFGDTTYGGNDQRKGLMEFLQIKTMGIDANYDSGDPNEESKKLPWGEWIHFAHTFDSATGDVILYMNGVEVNRANGGAGKVFNATGLSILGSSQTYFRDYIELAQVRLWKTTRSAAQIKKFMKKEVKYTDPNLVFYLPMNEGSGSTLHDVTGNGHDVEIGSADNGGNNQANAWTEYEF